MPAFDFRCPSCRTPTSLNFRPRAGVEIVCPDCERPFPAIVWDRSEATPVPREASSAILIIGVVAGGLLLIALLGAIVGVRWLLHEPDRADADRPTPGRGEAHGTPPAPAGPGHVQKRRLSEVVVGAWDAQPGDQLRPTDRVWIEFRDDGTVSGGGELAAPPQKREFKGAWRVVKEDSTTLWVDLGGRQFALQFDGDDRFFAAPFVTTGRNWFVRRK